MCATIRRRSGGSKQTAHLPNRNRNPIPTVRKIDLADVRQVEAAKQKQIKARARMFLECAIENALAAYGGRGRDVENIVLEMLEQMKG